MTTKEYWKIVNGCSNRLDIAWKGYYRAKEIFDKSDPGIRKIRAYRLCNEFLDIISGYQDLMNDTLDRIEEEQTLQVLL